MKMEIIYNGQKYWLLKIGESGKESNQAICLDENGKRVKIELNFTAVGSYTMPPRKGV